MCKKKKKVNVSQKKQKLGKTEKLPLKHYQKLLKSNLTFFLKTTVEQQKIANDRAGWPFRLWNKSSKQTKSTLHSDSTKIVFPLVPQPCKRKYITTLN